ncbi:hypothetical protein [Pedobacter deserti]|uniref:hypothetical protein n=1 Tax=Pedobacter deserti TaxID=2817382 RepID=UPI00351DC01A
MKYHFRKPPNNAYFAQSGQLISLKVVHSLIGERNSLQVGLAWQDIFHGVFQSLEAIYLVLFADCKKGI